MEEKLFNEWWKTAAPAGWEERDYAMAKAAFEAGYKLNIRLAYPEVENLAKSIYGWANDQAARATAYRLDNFVEIFDEIANDIKKQLEGLGAVVEPRKDVKYQVNAVIKALRNSPQTDEVKTALKLIGQDDDNV